MRNDGLKFCLENITCIIIVISGRIIAQFMRGPENMASDSEPRKIFSRPPRGPLRSHISGGKKPVRLLMSNDSVGVEVGR